MQSFDETNLLNAKTKRKQHNQSHENSVHVTKRPRNLSTYPISSKLTESAHKVSGACGVDGCENGDQTTSAEKTSTKEKGASSSREDVYLSAKTMRPPFTPVARDTPQLDLCRTYDNNSSSVSNGHWVGVSGMTMGLVYLP